MSDGTKYHKDSLTCAHRRYPLGTYLKVTNIKNGKSTVVKVTDRCGRRRIIDLSYAAAKEIGIITAGVAMVRVEKYVKEKGVPYKNEEKVELPELDYEVTQPGGTFMPEWMNNKATEKKTPEKKASGNKKEKTKR